MNGCFPPRRCACSVVDSGEADDGGDGELVATRHVVSLKCPVSLARFIVPVRGRLCSHTLVRHRQPCLLTTDDPGQGLLFFFCLEIIYCQAPRPVRPKPLCNVADYDQSTRGKPTMMYFYLPGGGRFFSISSSSAFIPVGSAFRNQHACMLRDHGTESCNMVMNGALAFRCSASTGRFS
jgi:hypothetical protein